MRNDNRTRFELLFVGLRSSDFLILKILKILNLKTEGREKTSNGRF